MVLHQSVSPPVTEMIMYGYQATHLPPVTYIRFRLVQCYLAYQFTRPCASGVSTISHYINSITIIIVNCITIKCYTVVIRQIKNYLGSGWVHASVQL